MNSIKLNVLWLSMFFVGIVSAQNQSVFISDSLDLYISRSMEEWNLPAIAVGIVKNGQVVYEKGFGVKSIQNGGGVNENTLFMIGSNTKAFTATALAKLDAEGVLSLEDRVNQWIPELSMQDTLASTYMNLTDIITHRTGMETFQGDFMYFDTDLSTQDVIEKFGKLDASYDYRTKWGYCNAGYVIAGEVLRKATNQPWNEYFKQHFFTPLAMVNTVTTVDEIRNAENASFPHSLEDNLLVEVPYGGLDLTGPAATISSSVADMNHWLTMLLDSGRFEGKDIVSSEVIERTRKPESIIGKAHHPFNKAHYKLYGLGWELMDYENNGIVSHTGGVHGFLSSVTLVPEQNLGIVILTNSDQNSLFEALKWEIIDAYLELPYRNYSSVYQKSFEKYQSYMQKELDDMRELVSEGSKPPLKLKNFAGEYESKVYGSASIKAVSNYLVMTLEHHPDMTVKMEYMSDSSFLCTYSNPMLGIKPFPFVIADDKVQSFTLSTASYLEFTTYDFIKVK